MQDMENGFIPQVKFELAPLDMEADLFYSFAEDGGGRWADFLNRAYPELLPMIKNVKNKTEGIKKCTEFAYKLHEFNKKEMQEGKERLQSEWSKVGSEFLKVLAEHFETAWPMNKPCVIGYVSVQPVFPRFLDTYSFCLGYKNISDMIEVAAHEILHFLWFKKWQEVFPKTGLTEHESPHLVWRLSEILDPIILQCHPKISELIKPKKWGYSSFSKIRIGNLGMTEYFRNIYLSSFKSRITFEKFLIQAWGEAKMHEKEISVF